MAHIICFANNKGGVGKTTSTSTIGDALARQGQRVLVVDMDPQASVSKALIGDNVIPEVTTVNLLLEKETEASSIFARGIVNSPFIEGVDLMPGHIDLDYVADELRLSSLTSPALYLRRRLAAVRDRYDFILIDTPPSMNLLTMNALGATDKLIIPFLAGDKMGLAGVSNLGRSISKIMDESINPNLEILGAIITGYDGREIAHQATEEVIGNAFKIIGKVQRSSAVQRGALKQRSVLKEDRNSRASREYIRIAAELMLACGLKPKRASRDQDDVKEVSNV